jgi:sugar/nucleoside kinase (ribokinase family)
MLRSYDVIAVGDYFIDLIFSGLPCFPELGKEIYGTGFEVIPGGAYNSVVAMHRLGVKVGWAVDFGDDEFSRMVEGRALAEGLCDGLFVRHNQPLRHITASVSYPEDRAFITYCDPDPTVPAATRALAKASARVLFVPGLYYGPLFDTGIRLAHFKHMQVVMDGNSTGDEIVLTDPAIRKVVRSVDVFMPNAREACRLTGRTDLSEAVCALGELCPLVVVKAGAAGAYACAEGRSIHMPGIPVTPIDTTGAGDCFNAGFLKARLDGRPLEECLCWGNIVGGLSTTARGGTGKVITTADVETWLQTHYAGCKK